MAKTHEYQYKQECSCKGDGCSWCKFKGYFWIDCEHPANYTLSENDYEFRVKRGGKRKGAGRPKKEPTITMRIPISKVEAVKKLIHD